MKILFITANRIGDAILSTGVLNHLVQTYPEARFTVACGPLCAELFAAMPRLDAVMSLKKRKWNGHWVDLWTQCVGTRWDLIVDLRNSLVTRFLRAEKKVWRGGRADTHKVRQNAAVLGLDPAPAPHIWLSAQDRAEAAEIVPPDVPVLALGPAANWPAKQWPAENFAALAARLTAGDGAVAQGRVLIVAAEQEREMIAPVLAALPEPRRIELIGGSLRRAAACLERATVFIGNDSGLMHLAAAVGTPVLGLFGPGYEKIYGPWGDKAGVVRTPESSEELLARLPYPGAFSPNLMQSLTVERVAAAVDGLLLKVRQLS